MALGPHSVIGELRLGGLGRVWHEVLLCYRAWALPLGAQSAAPYAAPQELLPGSLSKVVCELGGDRLIQGGGGGREARGRAALRSTGAREAPFVGKAQTASRMGLGAGGGW